MTSGATSTFSRFGRSIGSSRRLQSQGGGGAPAGDLGRLADVQKEIVVATWKLDGQPVERVGDDIETVADAQGELRLTAQLLAARTRRPAPEGRSRDSGWRR